MHISYVLKCQRIEHEAYLLFLDVFVFHTMNHEN